jgi:CheY-like chemotaxis protein
VTEAFSPIESRPFFAISHVAYLLGVSVQGVHLWIRTGKISGVQRTSKRGHYRIPRREVVRLLRDAGCEVAGVWTKSWKRVLFIDGDESIRDMVTQAFLDSRFSVELMTASTAEDGLLLAAQFLPEVIVLDCFFPRDRLNSDQAVAFIRRAKLTKGVRVIAVTATKDAGKRTLSAGADAFVLKPFGVSELRGVVLDQTSDLHQTSKR